MCVKGPMHPQLNPAFNCVKILHEKPNWMFADTAQFSPLKFVGLGFFISSVCLLVHVTVVDKNKAVVCCLLTTLAIMLSDKKKIKRKMWSKKWYLKRNISCDAHLLVELLETDGSWDDAIVVSADKLRRKCGIPWVNCTVVRVKDDWKDSS